MNKRFLTLAGVAAVLSVGTYVGLNIVKPYKHEEPKVADVTSPDQVFGGSVANPEAHADEAGATPAAAGAAPAADAAAVVQPTDTAVQPASAEQTAAAPAAEAPAAAAPAAASGSGSVAPLVPAGPAGTTPAASTETAAAAAPEPAPAPAAEPAPAPEPVAEAPAAPAPKAKKATHSASSGKSSKSSSSAKVWWPAEKDDKLSLVYAGPASFKKAVVLMFNGAFFKDDGISSHIKVTDKSGKAVSGSWELGENNRRMLVFPVSGAGTYKVSIASGLTDSKGRKLGAKLSGPVIVK